MSAVTKISEGPQEVAPPWTESLRTPILWGVGVGILQAASPVGFRWLDSDLVWAIGLAVIASIYMDSRSPTGARSSSLSRWVWRRASSSSALLQLPHHRGSWWSVLRAMASRICGNTALDSLRIPGGGHPSVSSWTLFAHPPSQLSYSQELISMDSSPGMERPGLDREPLDVLVIGGGQAGLVMGYQLAQRGLRFAILDAGTEIGDAWHRRWDSLKLFTPAQYDNLPGMPFPASRDVYPSKENVAAFLKEYVRRFKLPVHLNAMVRSLTVEGGIYSAQTDAETLTSRQVVVATGPSQIPFIPAIASDFDADVVQLHSVDYRNPGLFPTGRSLWLEARTWAARLRLSYRHLGRWTSWLGNGFPPSRSGRYLGTFGGGGLSSASPV